MRHGSHARAESLAFLGVGGYAALRGGGHRGFSPTGFLILLCLMVGFLGPETTGLLLGTVVGLIIAGAIARSMAGAPENRHRGGYAPTGGRAPATPAVEPTEVKPTCLCGSSEHTTLEHAATGPHSRDVESRFQSQLAVELVAGRITVARH